MAAAPTLDRPWQGENYAPPRNNDIHAVEAAIVARLQEQVSGIEIAHYPDQPETYRLTHRVGAALVIYDGSEYGELLSTDPIIQEREMLWDIGIPVRALGWAYASGDAAGLGAYQILDECRRALTGFKAPGCTKMYPKRDHFVRRDEQGAVWYYAIVMAHKTWAVEVSVEENFPKLRTVSIEESGGQTTIAVPAADYRFAANNQIQLQYPNVSNVVVQSQDGANTYIAGTDYSVDTVNGLITRLGGLGVIEPNATVRIAYSWSEVANVNLDGGAAPTAPSN